MDDSGEKEYDVVLDALKIHRDKLWKMTNSHNDWGSMDTLRMEQIAKLDEAVQAMGKKEWIGLTDAIELKEAWDKGYRQGIQARKEGDLIVADLPQVPRGSCGISKDAEPTIDGWPLYSGLPPVKVQDEREANYKSFAQSAQVLGAQYDPRRKPSGSWTSWDNTMCNPLANARMQTQSAWQDGYDSAKAKWVGLTKEDLETVHQELLSMSGGSFNTIAKAIEAKLKEKNNG